MSANKKDMDTFSFEELDTLTRYHLRFYRLYLKREHFRGEHLEVRESSHNPPLEKSYVFSIQTSLDQLDSDERQILVQECLENAPKNWWMNYFSKTTYYRIKYRAISRFIHCLHHETMV